MSVRLLADERIARKLVVGLRRAVDDVDIVRIQGCDPGRMRPMSHGRRRRQLGAGTHPAPKSYPQLALMRAFFHRSKARDRTPSARGPTFLAMTTLHERSPATSAAFVPMAGTAPGLLVVDAKLGAALHTEQMFRVLLRARATP